MTLFALISLIAFSPFAPQDAASWPAAVIAGEHQFRNRVRGGCNALYGASQAAIRERVDGRDWVGAASLVLETDCRADIAYLLLGRGVEVVAGATAALPYYREADRIARTASFRTSEHCTLHDTGLGFQSAGRGCFGIPIETQAAADLALAQAGGGLRGSGVQTRGAAERVPGTIPCSEITPLAGARRVVRAGNVRSQPSTEARVVDQLRPGEELPVSARFFAGGRYWLEITKPNQYIAVAAESLFDPEPAIGRPFPHARDLLADQMRRLASVLPFSLEGLKVSLDKVDWSTRREDGALASGRLEHPEADYAVEIRPSGGALAVTFAIRAREGGADLRTLEAPLDPLGSPIFVGTVEDRVCHYGDSFTGSVEQWTAESSLGRIGVVTYFYNSGMASGGMVYEATVWSGGAPNGAADGYELPARSNCVRADQLDAVASTASGSSA